MLYENGNEGPVTELLVDLNTTAASMGSPLAIIVVAFLLFLLGLAYLSTKE